MGQIFIFKFVVASFAANKQLFNAHPKRIAVSNVPFAGATELWLVVVSPYLMTVTYSHGPIPLSLNFRQFNSTTKPTTRRHPTHSTTAARPSRLPLYIRRRLSFNCCVKFQKMAPTLRPRHPPTPSLYFSIRLFLPYPGYRTDGSDKIPTARGLRMAWGSGGAVIGWRRCCTQDREEGKADGSRVGWLQLVVMCSCGYVESF